MVLYEVLDEVLPEIDILYIPTDTHVNIFHDDVLKNYYNDFMDDEYKADMLLQLHKQVLNPKPHSVVYFPKDCKYKSFEDDCLIKKLKVMATYNYEQYDINKKNYMNPLEFEIKDYEYVDHGYVEFSDRNFYIDSTFPISGKQYRYMTSRDETLWSRMSYTPEHMYENILEDINIRDRDIYTIDNELKRYGKSFYDMTEDELDIVRKFKDDRKVHKTKYPDKLLYKSMKLLHTDDMIIGSVDTEMNPMDFDKYGTIKNNLANTQLMYFDKNGKYHFNNMIKDIANNTIDVTEFKNNMDSYLKLLRTEHVLETLLEMKKTVETFDKDILDNELELVVGDKDMLKNQYVGDGDFAEVLEGEQDDNIYNIYMVNDVYEDHKDYNDDTTPVNNVVIDTSIYTDPFNYDSDMHAILKNKIDIIVALQITTGIPVDILSILDECVKSHDKDIVACFILVMYLRLQESVYNYSFNDLDVYYNKHCVDVMEKEEAPIYVSDTNDTNYIEISEKNILKYIICCLQFINDKELDVLDRVVQIVRKHDSFKEQLKQLHAMYDSFKSNLVNTNDMYLKMIKNLKDDMKKNNDTVHEKFVKSLLYIPSILNRVNTYKMGCCKQLLSINFTSFSDISNVDGKNVLRYVKRYMEEFNKSKTGRWNTISYPAYIEYEHMIDIVDTNYNVDEQCDKIDLYKELEPLVDFGFPLDSFKKNKNTPEMLKFIKDTANNLLFYAGVKDTSFNDFIINGCLETLNVRRILFIMSSHVEPIYATVVNKILQECCGDKDYKEQSKYALRYIACMMLNSIDDVDIAHNIYQEITSYDKEIMTRESYNKAINNIRENYKLHVINILESKTKEEKELLITLKKYGVYDYTTEDAPNNGTDGTDGTDDDLKNDYHYGGDDDNDKDMRD